MDSHGKRIATWSLVETRVRRRDQTRQRGAKPLTDIHVRPVNPRDRLFAYNRVSGWAWSQHLLSMYGMAVWLAFGVPFLSFFSFFLSFFFFLNFLLQSCIGMPCLVWNGKCQCRRICMRNGGIRNGGARHAQWRHAEWRNLAREWKHTEWRDYKDRLNRV